ncbi:arginine--tRNA ligase [Flavobacteriaceae bacterium]|nr:arginine--tRNA ligase [Flavobacteriaceae bacterium]MDA9571744.1 arginine--tRNA ligase [Flavobacteriaceae bacterium]MDB3862686.1 arginine--tRNA ligase [Flavobacteriaceae bacterium]
MQSLAEQISESIHPFLKDEYNVEVPQFDFQATRKEFDGDITLVVFSLLKFIKTNPVQLSNQIGEFLKSHSVWVTDFNVVKGFLNLSIEDRFYVQAINQISNIQRYGHSVPDSNSITLVEYSSPNTNKPLHLGHIRNNLLGYSVAQILEASGRKVLKTQIINDRGIHICKSMVAWKRFSSGETPESSGIKGDKLVGNYYVRFDQEYKKEIETLVKDGMSEDQAKTSAPLFKEAQAMLRAWEAGNNEVVDLWQKMNNWVYDGFETTYTNLGVSFDSYYYESKTYLLGKELIDQGLKQSIFYQKEDGSIWVDLTEDGLDEKLLLRSDGTAVYMTQDLGTALQRFKDNPTMDGIVYTVGNEQDYHFKVLFLILKKLGFSWAESLHHLSYGMVDLPEGKMKSREGTVVDADDLMQEMTNTAAALSEELGKLEGMSNEDKKELYQIIGLGALKYFILKVDPKKSILFDPKTSVDFAGNTGPFIQYTYARIQSILRSRVLTPQSYEIESISAKEKDILKQLLLYPETIQQAAKQYSPALIANYIYDLVKLFNSFYQNIPILGGDDSELVSFRISLCNEVGKVISSGAALLGISVPKRM